MPCRYWNVYPPMSWLTRPSLSPPHPRACYTPQGYQTPSSDKGRPARAAATTPTLALLNSTPLSSSAPKSFYGKSRTSAWQPEDNGLSSLNIPTTSSTDNNSNKKYVSPFYSLALQSSL